MLTQLLNESAPSGEQAQGAVAFSRLTPMRVSAAMV